MPLALSFKGEIFLFLVLKIELNLMYAIFRWYRGKYAACDALVLL